MRRAIVKEIVQHVSIPAKVIPATHHTASFVQQLIIIHRHLNILKRVEQWRVRRILKNKMVCVLVYVLVE